MLALNLSLRRVPTSVVCDISASLEPIVVQYVTCTSVMWNLKTSSAQTLRADFSAKSQTSCVQYQKFLFEEKTQIIVHRVFLTLYM